MFKANSCRDVGYLSTKHVMFADDPRLDGNYSVGYFFTKLFKHVCMYVHMFNSANGYSLFLLLSLYSEFWWGVELSRDI